MQTHYPIPLELACIIVMTDLPNVYNIYPKNSFFLKKSKMYRKQ